MGNTKNAKLNMVLRAALVISFCIGTAARAQESDNRLKTVADYLVQSGSVWMTGNTSCELFDGSPGRTNAYQGSDSEALLAVARNKNIYLFAHSFNPNLQQNRPTMPDVRKAWAQQLQLLDDVGRSYAACLFAIDSTAGFGEHQSEIGDFLFALRWLTDQEQLYDPERWIALVGHSSGVNYLKQAQLKFRQHLAANSKPPEGLKPTNTLFVFLAGQHKVFYTTDDAIRSDGAPAFEDLLTQGFGRFWSSLRAAGDPFESMFQKNSDALDKAKLDRLMNSRGAKQLTGNGGELSELHRRFVGQLTANVKITEVAVNEDDRGDINWTGVNHDVVTYSRIGLFDIVNPYADARVLSKMRRLYREHGPFMTGMAQNNQAIFPCPPRRCSTTSRGETLFESRSGRYWFYQDGAVASTDDWPDG